MTENGIPEWKVVFEFGPPQNEFDAPEEALRAALGKLSE
jgi:hypothetical protein